MHDGVDELKQLARQLQEKLLITRIFNNRAYVCFGSLIISACGLLLFSLLNIGFTPPTTFWLVIHLTITLIGALQILHREKASIDTAAFTSEYVLKTAPGLVAFCELDK